MISSFGLSLILAIVACVIGGVLGGLTLARPGSVLAPPPPLDDEGAAHAFPRAEGRALGGLLIVGHAAVALFLGYQPSVGAAMALALSMAWLGAALGRGVSMLVDRTERRFNLGAVAFEVLIAVTLALPFFNPGRLVVLKGALLS